VHPVLLLCVCAPCSAVWIVPAHYLPAVLPDQFPIATLHRIYCAGCSALVGYWITGLRMPYYRWFARSCGFYVTPLRWLLVTLTLPTVRFCCYYYCPVTLPLPVIYGIPHLHLPGSFGFGSDCRLGCPHCRHDVVVGVTTVSVAVPVTVIAKLLRLFVCLRYVVTSHCLWLQLLYSLLYSYVFFLGPSCVGLYCYLYGHCWIVVLTIVLLLPWQLCRCTIALLVLYLHWIIVI